MSLTLSFPRYKFALENEVILIDDYDQIYRDMLPFLGLPSTPLRQRSTEIITDTGNFLHGGSFTFKVEGGAIADISGGAKEHTRMKDQLSLMERFVQYLPDMNITIWAHDAPMLHIAGEKRKELEDLASAGKSGCICCVLDNWLMCVIWQPCRNTAGAIGVICQSTWAGKPSASRIRRIAIKLLVCS